MHSSYAAGLQPIGCLVRCNHITARIDYWPITSIARNSYYGPSARIRDSACFSSFFFPFFSPIKLPSLPRFPSREREQGVLVKEGTRPTLSALGVAAVASISRRAVALPVLSLLPVRGHEQVPIGSAEVRAVFSSGSGRVAGCMVTEGKIVDGCGIRVIRNGRTVHVSVLDSLRRVKEIVKEVNAGLECGMGVEDYDQWQEGDILEAFNTVQKKRTLEEASTSMAAALEGVGVEL